MLLSASWPNGHSAMPLMRAQGLLRGDVGGLPWPSVCQTLAFKGIGAFEYLVVTWSFSFAAAKSLGAYERRSRAAFLYRTWPWPGISCGLFHSTRIMQNASPAPSCAGLLGFCLIFWGQLLSPCCEIYACCWVTVAPQICPACVGLK